MSERCFQCATCGRVFPTEDAIRGHQDLYAVFHRIDPEIDEHDGEPWVTRPAHAVAQLNASPDIVGDLVAALCDLVFADPEILERLAVSVRRVVVDRLTGDPARAFEFNRRSFDVCQRILARR